MRHFPKTFLSKHGKFCGVDCHAHVNDHGNYNRSRKEAKQKQSSASDFKYSVKRRKKMRQRDTNSDKASDAEFLRPVKFQYPLNKKDRTYGESVENGGCERRRLVRRLDEPVHQTMDHRISTCFLAATAKEVSIATGLLMADGPSCCLGLELRFESKLILPWGVVRIGLRNLSESRIAEARPAAAVSDVVVWRV
jgi:hypothetical protein